MRLIEAGNGLLRSLRRYQQCLQQMGPRPLRQYQCQRRLMEAMKMSKGELMGARKFMCM
jgi:hypothetical protein